MKLVRLIFILVIALKINIVNSQPQTASGCLNANCHGEFLLNLVIHTPFEDGCEDCHLANQNKHPDSDGNEFELTDSEPQLCYMCHDEYLQKEYKHDPVESGDCLTCHDPHSSENKKLLLSNTNELCSDCHDIDFSLASQHNPVESGNCIECHNPHESDNRSLLIRNTYELCLDCHDEQEKQLKYMFLHDPFDGGCLDCHKAHSSEIIPLLLADYPSGLYSSSDPDNFQLCFGCHDVVLMTEKNDQGATSFRDGNLNLHYLHLQNSKARNCNICHNSHASQKEFILNSEITFGNWQMPLDYEKTANGGICLTACHSPKEYKSK